MLLNALSMMFKCDDNNGDMHLSVIAFDCKHQHQLK